MPAENLRTILASLSATIHVSDEAPGVVRLDLLSVPEQLRGRGCARDALTRISEWADETGTVIVLTATFALGAHIQRLVALYMSYRFVPIEVTTTHEVRMCRSPLVLVPATLPTTVAPQPDEAMQEPTPER